MKSTVWETLRRSAVALVAIALLAGAGAAVLALRSTPTYAAESTMLVGPVTEDADAFKASSQLIGTYAELIKNEPALTQAAATVGMTPTALEDVVDVNFSTVTRLLTLTVTLPNPSQAASVNRLLAARLVGATKQPNPAGVVSVLEPPVAKPTTTTAAVLLRAGLAGLATLVVGALLLLFVERTRSVLRDGRDVRSATGVDALTAFPARGRRRLSKTEQQAAAAAGYRVLTAFLETLPRHGAPQSVAVVGAGEEGHSRMALNLAVALARSGRRVAVVGDHLVARGSGDEAFATKGDQVFQMRGAYLVTPGESGNAVRVEPWSTFSAFADVVVPWSGSQSTHKMSQALAATTGLVDVVVLAPGSVANSDSALAWVGAVDAVFLAVGAGTTTTAQLTEALSILKRVTDKPVEVVIAGRKTYDGPQIDISLPERAAGGAAKWGTAPSGAEGGPGRSHPEAQGGTQLAYALGVNGREKAAEVHIPRAGTSVDVADLANRGRAGDGRANGSGPSRDRS